MLWSMCQGDYDILYQTYLVSRDAGHGIRYPPLSISYPVACRSPRKPLSSLALLGKPAKQALCRNSSLPLSVAIQFQAAILSKLFSKTMSF